METKECKAMSRGVSPFECQKIQTELSELPGNFCDKCSWKSDIVPLITRPRKKSVTERISSKYTVYLSKKLKEILIEVAKEKNMQPSELIAKIVMAQLLPDDDLTPAKNPPSKPL